MRAPNEARDCKIDLMISRAGVTSVSEHLAAIPADVRPIVEAARRTVRAVAPKADEIACRSKKPRSKSTMWKLVRYAVDGKVVVTIGTFSKHSSIFFARGSEIEDAHGLLAGTGASLRYITLRTPGDASSAAVKAIVREAFALASKEKASRGAHGLMKTLTPSAK
jgi:hypothetical protein